jgi:hypothetical protein
MVLLDDRVHVRVVEPVRVPPARREALAADRVGEVDGDELRAGLDEPAAEEQRLAVRVPAVRVAQVLRLGGEVERIPQPRRVEHRQRLGVVIVEPAGGGGVVEQARLLVDYLLQFTPRFEPADRHVGGET